MANKADLINFLEVRVLRPADCSPLATTKIKRKIHVTRIRLAELTSARAVEKYFWSALASDRGINSYECLKALGLPTFEDVRADFKALCI